MLQVAAIVDAKLTFLQHIIVAPPCKCRDALRCPYSSLAEPQVVALGHPNMTLGLTSYAMTIHHP